MHARRVAVLLLAGAVASCGGSGGGSSQACIVNCPGPPGAFTIAEVEGILARAVAEARAQGVRAQVVVVDRVGNVLAAYRMAGAPETVAVTGGLGVVGGLDGIPAGVVPAAFAALAKALTGAYLSSGGNAFSTRTAGQIVQEHFNPQEPQQPSGPLYGVQFSQLPCSDVNRTRALHGEAGPKRSPLGLSADPGGLPLYRDGRVVGGLGVEADGLYGFDRDITDVDRNVEELIALAGSFGFEAPADIRAERITADGRTFRYVDSDALASDPRSAPALAALPGSLVAIAGYSAGTAIEAGTVYGARGSGIEPDTGAFAAIGGWIVADASGANRFPPRDSPSGTIREEEVRALLSEALAVAGRARAQIRRPLGSAAQVSVAVVDTEGAILGLVRAADAPIFGIDVAVQKARTAMFFSHPEAGALLAAAPAAQYATGGTSRAFATYAQAFRQFVGAEGALAGGVAWSARAIGNLHRPFFPDGIEGTPAGPLSTPITGWSPFNVGFQLDISYNQLIRGVLGDTHAGCAGRQPAGSEGAGDAGLARLRNGAQIFPGGVPIFRGETLVGAIGVSGDGVDQDDMVATLGIANAARALATGIGHAPPDRRADRLTPHGVRLRYVQCPQAPFNGSNEQDACAGI